MSRDHRKRARQAQAAHKKRKAAVPPPPKRETYLQRLNRERADRARRLGAVGRHDIEADKRMAHAFLAGVFPPPPTLADFGKAFNIAMDELLPDDLRHTAGPTRDVFEIVMDDAYARAGIYTRVTSPRTGE